MKIIIASPLGEVPRPKNCFLCNATGLPDPLPSGAQPQLCRQHREMPA